MFLKEEKSFKLTTILLFILVLTYSPILIVRILIVKIVITSSNAAYIAFLIAIFLLPRNLLINPVIYCVRIRDFRVAFIEIPLRKNGVQANQIEMQIFGTLKVLVQPEIGQQEKEGQTED